MRTEAADLGWSNLHYTDSITPKRATSDGAHLRDLAPGKHSYENCGIGGVPLATQCPI